MLSQHHLKRVPTPLATRVCTLHPLSVTDRNYMRLPLLRGPCLCKVAVMTSLFIIILVWTQAHPLTGLWKGDFMGRAGVQIISISYYFKGPAAIIRADKVFPP